jgi:hypothetical protein
VSKNLLEKTLEDNSLSVELADEYLKMYVADIDWKPHIQKLWNNFYNKNKNEEESKNLVKRAISCAILLPITDNTQVPDPPHSLLFWCTGWAQFYERDWFDLFKETIKKDIEIKNNRKQVISSGIIDPIEYSPMTRQAFNWLYEKAESSGEINDDNKEVVVTKLKNMVKVYGGAVICSIFVNHQSLLDKVISWRNGYFFEKQIYKVYTVEKIHKIKKWNLVRLIQVILKK